MNDEQLAERLNRAAVPLAPALIDEALSLAAATAAEVTPVIGHKQLPMKRRWRVPALIIGGAVLLTGGAGYGFYSMNDWTGTELREGEIRNSEPILLSYTDDAGAAQICRAHITLAQAEPGDKAALDAALSGRDWSELSQRLYDAAPPPSQDDLASGSHVDEHRMLTAFEPELEVFIKQVFPGIHWYSESFVHGEGYLPGRRVEEVGIGCEAE